MDELTTRHELTRPYLGARYDLAVHNARLVTPEGIRTGHLAVTGGRIAALTEAGDPPSAHTVIDARGRCLLPGLIDSHVHFRTPGLLHKEDWAHASRAAVAGGITTVIDMPNTDPPLFDPELAAAKAALIEGDSLVDFRFHLGVPADDPSALARLTPRVATSAKVFLAGHHTAPHVVRDPAVLDQLFATAARAGVRLVLHAEDDAVFALLDEWAGAATHYRDYEPRRPRTGGVVAVARVIELVRRHGTQAHVLHVSSAEEADLLTAAAHVGLPVTFEVTAHHLSFTAADTARYGARIRLSPAIRQATDQRRLWQAVVEGHATTIGSDHAPHTIAEKTRPVADAPPGLPGVQELLPAVFTGLRRRHPELGLAGQLGRVTDLLAAAPARMFGIDGRKGRLAVGADADFVVFDPDARWMVNADQVYAKCGWSAYEGWTMTGRVDLTVRRGDIVWDAAARTFGPATGTWLDASGPAPEPAHTGQRLTAGQAV